MGVVYNFQFFWDKIHKRLIDALIVNYIDTSIAPFIILQTRFVIQAKSTRRPLKIQKSKKKIEESLSIKENHN